MYSGKWHIDKFSFTDEVHMFSKINRNIYKPPVSEAVSSQYLDRHID